MRRTLNALLFLMISCVATSAHAQSPDAIREKVKDGDKVTITDERGRSFSGRIGGISGDTVTLLKGDKRTELPLAQVLKIDRPKDPVWNGALLGLGVGAAVGLWQARYDEDYYQGDDPFCGVGFFDNCTDPAPSKTTYAIGWGVVGALVGAGVDGLIHRGDRTIYRRGSASKITLAPLAGRGRRGAAVSFTW